MKISLFFLKAALKAYVNDVKSDSDFTAQLIRSGVETLPIPQCVEPKQNTMSSTKLIKKSVAAKKWMEAISDDGHTYYWNADTGGIVNTIKVKCFFLRLSITQVLSSGFKIFVVIRNDFSLFKQVLNNFYIS